MHIGLLTSDLTPHHGWGNYSLNLIEQLTELGHDLTILSAHNSDPIDHPAHHRMLPAVAPQEPYFLAKLWLASHQATKLTADCDVMHTTIEFYAPLLQWIARKRPTFMTAHGSYINLPLVRRFPISRLYHDAFTSTHIVNVSHYTQSVAQQIVPDAKTSVVVNAVDAMKFAHINHSPSDHPIVVTLGGVKARKGTHHLVQAIAEVRQHLPNIQCHIFGTITAEANYSALVRQQISESALEDVVHLHGFTDDETVEDWYAKADVFALPSMNAKWKFEGFGLATMEASAAGLPVIGTYDCGAEEVIDHEKTGLLVSQENIAKELPQALLRILTNREKAHQMGLAGRQKAQSRTWLDVATELETLYQAELNQKR